MSTVPEAAVEQMLSSSLHVEEVRGHDSVLQLCVRSCSLSDSGGGAELGPCRVVCGWLAGLGRVGMS